MLLLEPRRSIKNLSIPQLDQQVTSQPHHYASSLGNAQNVPDIARLCKNTYSFSFLKYGAGISTGASNADTPLNCSKDLLHS